jgi:hypothetical protein
MNTLLIDVCGAVHCAFGKSFKEGAGVELFD